MRMTVDMDLATVDTDGIFDGLTGAGPWDSDDWKADTQLNGGALDGLAHQLSFVSDADVNTLTFTVTGTDADNNVITEDVTGVTTSPVETTKYFKTVTALEASATLDTNTLDVGWVDEAVSPTVYLDSFGPNSAYIQLDVTGTIHVTVDITAAEPHDFANQNAIPWMASTVAALDDETADSTAPAAVGLGARALRFRVTSYSTGAEFQAYMLQADHP